MNLEGLHITIVGAAIGGSAAALLLARAGAHVTLIEKVAAPRAVGAGIGIADNGLAVLDGLGLGAAVREHGRSVGNARIVDGKGRTVFAPPDPQPAIWMLRRSVLQHLMHGAIEAEPCITRCFGAEVLAATRDGAVVVADHRGQSDLLADLVIGADGVHSRVRTGGNFGRVRVRTGITYLRALVAGVPAKNVEAWTSAGLFGSFAVDTGTYLFASAGSRATRVAIAARDLDALKAAWANAYPSARRLLAPLSQWDELLFNPVTRIDCERWSDGRLVLLGDAAHAMAPNLGQGANSALVDAAVLLDALRHAPTIEAALHDYEARRRPAVRRVADTAQRLGALAELTHPVARFLRNRLLMPLAQRLASADTNRIVLQEEPATLRTMSG